MVSGSFVCTRVGTGTTCSGIALDFGVNFKFKCLKNHAMVIAPEHIEKFDN
jgi:hypothetical protein